MGFSFSKLVDPFGLVFKDKSPKIPKPEESLKLAPEQAKQLISYYEGAIPGFLALSEKFGPQFLEQTLGQTSQFLGGVGGQPGFMELLRTTGAESGKTLADLRAGELGTMAGQTPLTRGLMEALSPEQAAAVKASAQEAERARVSAMGVTPQEQRTYEQTAREAAQASGRLGGNAAFAAEVMGREDMMRKKREEAALAGARSYGLAGEFYTKPGLDLLSKTPLSYGEGKSNLGIAMTAGPASSGTFDYNMPLGFAKERAGALDAYNMAKYQADMQKQAQLMQLFKTGASIAAAPFTGGASLAFMGS